MPLDKETNKYYPFVGLKHESDSVKILSSKKKGFFSSIFEWSFIKNRFTLMMIYKNIIILTI